VTRALVWQSGRFGAGPLLAALLAQAFEALGGVESILSLSSGAEILQGPSAPRCRLPVRTHSGAAGVAWRLMLAPLTARQLARRLREVPLDFAVCAMPAPLDLPMALALRRLRIPIAVIVHDAEIHPGDVFPLLLTLQKALLRRTDLVIALSSHVAAGLRSSGAAPPGLPIRLAKLPPLTLEQPAPPEPHGGPRRVLCFGRLRTYKGLDLLVEALRLLGPLPDIEVRVVGQGQEGAALAALRALPGVSVENRWVPEGEVGAILNWADIVVLPYREASQSGIAPTALAAGRRVVATRVGGLAEQLAGEPLATLCEPDAGSLAAALAGAAKMPPGNPIDADGAWREFAAGILDAFRLLPALDSAAALTDARLRCAAQSARS
jgi:glycosyltransferase involved in cell wall biosynthesis